MRSNAWPSNTAAKRWWCCWARLTQRARASTPSPCRKAIPPGPGPLAGVSLGLPVYHITEEAVKNEIPEDVFEEHVALMEVVLDIDDIAKAAQEVRTATGQQA